MTATTRTMRPVFGILLLAVGAVAARDRQSLENILSIPLVPHAVHQRRIMAEQGWIPEEVVLDRPRHYPRRLASANDPTPVSELFQGYGTHYADLWVGAPPQRQTVIVDTGSGTTAFPCSGCQKCGVPKYHSDGLFMEDMSETFEALTCHNCFQGDCRSGKCSLSRFYLEGSSWSAYEAQDRCYIGGMHSSTTQDDHGTDSLDPFHAPAFGFDLKFGCQTHLKGMFEKQLADGIMGMDNDKGAYWKQMYAAGAITRKAFSLCYSRHDQVSRQGTESGAMTLGGSDPRLHNGDMVYTDIDMRNRFLGVKLRNMYIREGGGGSSAVSSQSSLRVESLGLPPAEFKRGQFIVDSGSTDTYLATSMLPYFQEVFLDVTGFKYGHGRVNLTQEERESLPTILFQFEGNEALNQAVQAQRSGKQVVGLANQVDPDHPLDVLIAMPPSHYMEYEPESGTYVARLYFEEDRGGGVFGANAMMGYDVLFDVEPGHMGWAESSCDYTALMEEHFPQFVELDKNDDNNERSDKANNDDGDVPEQPDTSGNSSNMPEPEICSSATCQGTMLAVMVAAFALAAINMRRVRRVRRTEIQYDTLQELELQSVPETSDDLSNHDEAEVDENEPSALDVTWD